jgi:hypothetical protein
VLEKLPPVEPLTTTNSSRRPAPSQRRKGHWQALAESLILHPLGKDAMDLKRKKTTKLVKSAVERRTRNAKLQKPVLWRWM